MREAVSFFTPVSYGNLHTSKFEKLLGFADDCFFFGGHKAVVIERSSLERSQRVELQSVQPSMWKTTFKIVAWLACFVVPVWNPIVWSVPVGLLALKIVCRMKQPFHIETETDPLQVPRAIKFHAPKDFRSLRNHESSSDLSVIPHAENDVPAEAIPVHSHLLPDFFQTRASSQIGLGLDEKEGKKKLDLSNQPFATKTNIDRLLDYYYGVSTPQNMSLEGLLNLFQLADYVLATELKKEILSLLQQLPEARKDPRFVPVIRNMLLSTTLDDVETSLLFEWFVECYRRADRAPFIDECVRNEAEKKEVRALILLNLCTPVEQRAPQLAALLEKEGNPLMQEHLGYMLVYKKSGFENDERKGIALLQQAAESGLPCAKGVLSTAYRTGECGIRKDLSQAMRLAEESALAGSLEGMTRLFFLCRGSEHLPRDGAKAFEAVSRAEKRGSRTAKICLADCYHWGIGVQTDRVRALDLYTQWLDLPREPGDNDNIDYARKCIQKLAH